MNCCAFLSVKYVCWFTFLNRHFWEVCPSSTSKLHEKHSNYCIFCICWNGIGLGCAVAVPYFQWEEHHMEPPDRASLPVSLQNVCNLQTDCGFVPLVTSFLVLNHHLHIPLCIRHQKHPRGMVIAALALQFVGWGEPEMVCVAPITEGLGLGLE
jgi:hypothetical protein